MIKIILAASFLLSNLSYGASNTLGVKGQSQVTVWEAGRVQVPNSQATLVGDKNVLLDTGNDNILSNASFENATGEMNWTAAGTAADELTDRVHGKKSLKITLSAYTGDVLTQGITPDEKVSGVPFKFTGWVKTSQPGLSFCPRIDAVEYDCSDIIADGQWHSYLATAIGQDGELHEWVIKTTSAVTGDLFVDKAYMGPWEGAKAGMVYQPWTDYTPTIVAGVGTLPARTNSKTQWMRIGENIYVRGGFTFSATGTWTNIIIGAPSGVTYDFTTAEFAPGEGTFYDANGDLYPNIAGLLSSTTITLLGSSGSNGAYTSPNQAFPFTWASTDRVRWMYGPIKVVEWTGQGSMNYTTNPVMDFSTKAYRATNQTGFNPNASRVKVQFNSVDPMATGKFDTTNNRFVAEVSGLHSFSAGVGFQSTNVLNNRYQLQFVKGGSTPVFHGNEYTASTTTAFTLAGSVSVYLLAGEYIEVFVYGWGNNSSSTLTIDNYPGFTWFSGGPSGTVAKNVTVPQSVTTGYQGVTVIATAEVSSTGVVSNDHSDFINGNCVMSGSGSAIGTCTMTTSFWSSDPTCFITNKSQPEVIVTTDTTASLVYGVANSSGTGTAGAVNVMCIGVR